MSNTNAHDYAAERLGIEPVGSLLLKFSTPAIVGMLVNALYNVVDRIFVGRGVNEFALGGLSLCLPAMTITMAFSMLFGIGCANLISMRLGEGKKETAENALNHCFFLLTFTGLLITVLGLVFLEPLLQLFGAGETPALGYARDYFRIILYGNVFGMVGFGFSHCTRAQGFPLLTMVGMFIGAGLNTVLDPIFIFIFQWGVKGAAWATVISQFCAMVFLLVFSFSRKPVIRLKFSEFHLDFGIIYQIMAFGSAQFLLQLLLSGVQFIYNKSMQWYGAAALGVANGGDVALSGMNIVGSVIMLIMMPIFGINQGSQPVLGFNYGARKFDRVKKAYITASGAASVISTLGFLVCQLFPNEIIHLFTPNGSAALMYFTPRTMRIQMALMLFVGFNVVSSNMFVVTGRPKVSIFLSMLRQFIALIPCMLIFGWLWGLWGVVWAQPVSDFVSTVVTTIFIVREMKRLTDRATDRE
jgi:putative MATE family efflux protein